MKIKRHRPFKLFPSHLLLGHRKDITFDSDLSGTHLRIPLKPSGGRLNKKDGLTRYGDSHVKDKTS